MPAMSLGGCTYIMICVDDLTYFKIVQFPKKSDAFAALRIIVAEFVSPDSSKIDSIRTDEGSEFKGEI